MVLIIVKNLKSLCIQKIVNVYKIDFDITSRIYFDDLVKAYKKLGPLLSKKVVYKIFGYKNCDFGKFIWFLHYFVWNLKKVYFYNTNFYVKFDHNESVLANWIRISFYRLSEINFVGSNYLSGQMCMVFMYSDGPKYKVGKLHHHHFNYQPDRFLKFNNLLKLTVLNSDFLSYHRFSTPVFFDLDKRVAFNFKQTLKKLDFPGFYCRARTHHEFLTEILTSISLFYHDFEFIKATLSANERDSLSILRFIKKTNKKYTLKESTKKKSEKNSQNLNKTLKNFSFLEKAELNLLDIPDKQKQSIIKNLNESLKILKLTFFQPISFLLYVGRRFPNLQSLYVAFLGNKLYVNAGDNKIDVEQTAYFDILNDMNLVVFTKLKSFSFFCNNIQQPTHLLLDTILTVLNGCQQTLTTFELKFYSFVSIKEIVDYICFKKAPLEFINFKAVQFLTDEDIMQIVQLNNNDKLFLKIEGCKKVTNEGVQAVMNYIAQNNLKKKIEFLKNYS